MQKKKVLKPKQKIHRITADNFAAQVGKVNYKSLKDLVKNMCKSKPINSVQLVPIDDAIFEQEFTLKFPINRQHLRCVVYAGLYPSKSISPKTQFAEFVAGRDECLLLDEQNPENNKVLKIQYITIFYIYIYHAKYHKSNEVIDIAHKEVQSIIDQKKKSLKN